LVGVGMLLNPLNILIGIIGVSAVAAVAGFALAYVEKFGSVEEATDNLKQTVTDWWNRMKEAWNDPVVKQAIDNVKQALLNVGNAVGDVINALLGKRNGGKPLKDQFSENKETANNMARAIDSVAGFLNWLADTVIPKIPGAIDSLKKAWDIAYGVFNSVREVIEFLEKARKVFSFTLDVIFPSRGIKKIIEWAIGRGYSGTESGGGGSFHEGGLVGMHEGGIPKAQTGMIIPGSSPLRDRVPIMAEQGEGIMSKKAIENLLKNGVIGGGGVTYNINFNPGVMIASPGERRNFAREIKKLLEQDESRYTPRGNVSMNAGAI